jgi:phage FluMu protein Com
MIKIDFSLAVALYLLSVLVIVVLAWLLFEHRLKGRTGFKSWQKKEVWQCSVCTYTYLDNQMELSRCPRCKSYNRRESNEAITPPSKPNRPVLLSIEAGVIGRRPWLNLTPPSKQ